ncbi:MAG TPA: hypothetical protein VHU80_06365, partial [Polyangiaceae bacterium]|nr:hypothetical protein [Polyangiaceae bacterium]
WLNFAAAREHCARGASVWDFASSDGGHEPDVVLACAGDVATLETLAAASWLRENAPDFRVRVVNVVDLMALASPEEHPHGMPEERFCTLFTDEVPVVFAFHGYAGAVHQILHGRRNTSRFHVRGYREEGTTTTPFDMVVLNQTSRFHLAAEAIRRTARPPANGQLLIDECNELLARHRVYIREHLEDMPEIQNFVWKPS